MEGSLRCTPAMIGAEGPRVAGVVCDHAFRAHQKAGKRHSCRVKIKGEWGNFSVAAYVFPHVNGMS